MAATHRSTDSMGSVFTTSPCPLISPGSTGTNLENALLSTLPTESFHG